MVEKCFEISTIGGAWLHPVPGVQAGVNFFCLSLGFVESSNLYAPISLGFHLMELLRFELQPRHHQLGNGDPPSKGLAVGKPPAEQRPQNLPGVPSSAHHLAGSHAEDLVEERWAGHGGG